jgi:hypothetical protein
VTDDLRPKLLTAAEAFEAGDYDRADDALVAALGTVRKQRGGQ